MRDGRKAEREPSSRCGLPQTAYSVLHMYGHLAKKHTLLAGETKKTLCRISFLVTSRISLVTLTSLPTVGGTRRKSRILSRWKAAISALCLWKSMK